MEHNIDELLNKPYYVIDFLPERVSKTANGHFFDVEYYLLNSEKHHEMKNKYVNIILKLMCYYRTSILWNGWKDDPKPEDIDDAVKEIMENHSGTLNILFPEENVLLVFEWDCLNLTVYNLPENMKELVEKIALSEGFFCWKGAD
ncbi:MAG: hypothetical protein NC086_09890 [Alistipes sp.]|nr:hypothetical protein [Alistipes sp.]